ncbi:MAG TPA: UPF0158 family protein [Thermoanaerobaculia bacterium]|nr:UPF0158 family protein [Thermoanaerobaculia bacterium]
MAISWMQKLRLGIRGWSRRQDEQRLSRDREFLQKNSSWGSPPVTPAVVQVPTSRVKENAAVEADLDGLQVAFLDDSGQIEHYLDRESGEVIEFLPNDPSPRPLSSDRRYARVPGRTEATENDDRRQFLDTIEDAELKKRLVGATASADAAGNFRSVLGTNRAAERAWYNFKNERAYTVIQEWLVTLDKT